MGIAIALGGGAPNLTLMTGALLALDEAGVEFEVVTTTGAGMVAGLLWAAPRREDRDESWPQARRRALRATREMGIDDLIYSQFPVNYKIFQKPGKLAEAYAHAVNPTIWSIPRDTRRRRLLGDSLGFMAAMMQPGSMSASSKGLCQPPPWIELIVDFDDLPRNLAEGDRKFRLTAFCIEDQRERTFHKHEITAEHFKAALAMPFIYSPYRMRDRDGEMKTWLEASAFQTMEFNPDDVMGDANARTLVYFDLMGNRQLIGAPRGLIDAWGKSIVAPLTQIAQQQIAATQMKRGAAMLAGHLGGELMSSIEMHWKIRGLLKEAKAASRSSALHALCDEIDALITTRHEELDAANETDLLAALQEFDPTSPFLRDALTEEEGAPAAQGEDADDREDGDETEDDGGESLDMLGHAMTLLATLSVITESHGRKVTDLTMLRMPFRDHIPADYWPKVLDWSHSNMAYLFDIGYRTGQCFVRDNWKALDLDRPPEPEGAGEMALQ